MVREPHIAAHECKPVMVALVDALHAMADEGERVIWRAPFRWMDKNGVINNGYEMFDLPSIADHINCDVVWDFNHAAIVRPRV